MKCNTPGFPVLHYLPELAQTHVHWVSDAIQPPHSASGSFPMSSLFESGGQSTGASALASVLPVSIQGWFPLGWTVQGSLKSLLQHHSSKASVRWHCVFFTGQLSQPDVTTGKTVALTRRTSVGREMSLLFNTLCRFVIAFLPRSNCLLIPIWT